MTTQQQTSQTSTNLGYQDFSALQLRLDTQKLHKDIWNFLRGKTQIVEYKEEFGQYMEKDIIIGKPLANEIGIQNILNFVISIINSHTAQGNTKREEYHEIIYFINIHLAQQLTLNNEVWDIDKNNRRHILNTIVTMTQLFLSRTIDNLERQGMQPVVSKESTIIENREKKGII